MFSMRTVEVDNCVSRIYSHEILDTIRLVSHYRVRGSEVGHEGLWHENNCRFPERISVQPKRTNIHLHFTVDIIADYCYRF